jgi:hypothetical protein
VIQVHWHGVPVFPAFRPYSDSDRDGVHAMARAPACSPAPPPYRDCGLSARPRRARACVARRARGRGAAEAGRGGTHPLAHVPRETRMSLRGPGHTHSGESGGRVPGRCRRSARDGSMPGKGSEANACAGATKVLTRSSVVVPTLGGEVSLLTATTHGPTRSRIRSIGLKRGGGRS